MLLAECMSKQMPHCTARVAAALLLLAPGSPKRLLLLLLLAPASPPLRLALAQPCTPLLLLWPAWWAWLLGGVPK